MKLSIIVPLYNSAVWIPKCIESLVHQDLAIEDYEIILVNDGSPDNSLEVAQNYANLYQNITVLSQQNKGVSGARNTGLRNASGKYVSFVDPDDYIQYNSLGELIRQMEDENLDLLRFNYVLVDEQYNMLPKSKSELVFNYCPRIMSGNEFISQRLGIACYVWAYIYKLSLIKDNGIWCVEGDYFDDTSWLPFVLMNAKRVNCTNREHYFYLQRANSLVKSRSLQSIDAKIEGQFKLLETLNVHKSKISDKNVVAWFDMMISFCSISLFTLVAVYKFQRRRDFILRYLSLNVYPVSILNNQLSLVIKTLFFNISPYLFCRIVHESNIIKNDT